MIGSRPNALDNSDTPLPRPRQKRPPVNVCMVMAKAAVTAGCRVWWLVAAVATPMRSEITPTAPESVAASLMFNRSLMNTEPKPIPSAWRTSATSSRGDSGAPANVKNPSSFICDITVLPLCLKRSTHRHC